MKVKVNIINMCSMSGAVTSVRMMTSILSEESLARDTRTHTHTRTHARTHNRVVYVKICKAAVNLTNKKLPTPQQNYALLCEAKKCNCCAIANAAIEMNRQETPK